MVIKRFPGLKSTSAINQFEQLIEPHLPHLYQLAYRFLNNQTDAEDLVQDLVVKLLPKTEEMTQIEKLRPWLARVLYRMFVDQYRQKERSPLSLVAESETALNEQAGPISDNPETQVAASLQQRELQSALQSLNSDQRAVVLLHDVEGYTLIELETILETPVGTLKSRLNRARGQLREILQKNH